MRVLYENEERPVAPVLRPLLLEQLLKLAGVTDTGGPGETADPSRRSAGQWSEERCRGRQLKVGDLLSEVQGTAWVAASARVGSAVLLYVQALSKPVPKLLVAGFLSWILIPNIFVGIMLKGRPICWSFGVLLATGRLYRTNRDGRFD